MESGLMVLAISGGTVLVLAALFALEDSRATRFVSPLRRGLDWLVMKVFRAGKASVHWCTHGALRVAIHYLIHKVLSRLVRMAEWCVACLTRWQRRNRRVVRAVQEERIGLSTLRAVREHKVSVALSDEEKQALKERHLSGK